MRPRSYAKQYPLSPFGAYLLRLSEQRGLPLSHVAEVVGGRSRLSYAIRRVAKDRRGYHLDYETLEKVAAALKANAAETSQLIVLGLLEWAPPELRSSFIGLAEDNRKLAERLNVRPSRYDFSGRERPLPGS